MFHVRNAEPARVPPRVSAALAYLSYCESVTCQQDPMLPARGLSSQEERVRASSLRVLLRYFEGEMDYGDAPPSPPAGEGEAPGSAPVPVR